MRGDERDETGIVAEDAGISEIPEEKVGIVNQLVNKLLPPPVNVHGYTTLIEHHIDVQSAWPFKYAPRRMSPKILEFAQREVKEMHERGVIERSASEWCSATVIVSERDSDYRFCVDFQNLNKLTRRDTCPIPNMDAILDKLTRRNSSR